MTTVITGLYGPFRYTPATDTWWWADDLYRIGTVAVRVQGFSVVVRRGALSRLSPEIQLMEREL